MLTDKIGEESVNSFGSKMICFKYRNNVDIDVYFPEYKWVYKHATYNNFKKGSIRCPYEPRVCGKGYIGEGPYKKFVDGEITKCYRTWSGMINRCYNNNQSHDNPSYVGCSVCDEWLNYQNFSNWFDLNYYECGNELMSLDKDILCKNNKIYGPDTCIFVPIRINTLFTKRYNDRGETPIGTTIYGHNNKIRVYCNNKEGLICPSFF